MSEPDQNQPEGIERGDWTYSVTIPALPPDTRRAGELCAICLRTLNPRRAVLAYDRWQVCRACASQHNEPWLVAWWCGLAREKRRAMLCAAHEVDPATAIVVDTDATLLEWREDEGPTIRGGNYAFGAGKYVLAIQTFWDLAPHRPRRAS